ncbi:MAG: MFS transporter, partial [Streptomycetaceae bacterium]|nr:MFS transporter [Streptomycetaceae bacterium]
MTTPVLAARNATYAAFIGSGFAFASWAARIPQVRDHLQLTPASLGLVLLSLSVGAFLGVTIAGAIVARFGSRRTVMTMAVALGVALAVIAAGYAVGVPVLVAGLFLLGLANGIWDVAMNVQGTVVERRLGRSIMSRFHAGFSVGTVAGALISSALLALSVPVSAHLAGVAVVVAATVALISRSFLPDQHDDPGSPATAEAPKQSTWSAWLEPRTLLIGIFVLAFTFAEGAGNDWISIAAIDGHDLSPVAGTLAFAAFLTAMTLGRWFGPPLLDRYGRVPVVRMLALIGIAGTALFVFGPAPLWVYAGTLLWGLGASLGFPVGMSAAADDPSRAAARVSVVAALGYCAFLSGPPVIGFLGAHVTVVRALLVIAVLFGIAALVSSSVR